MGVEVGGKMFGVVGLGKVGFKVVCVVSGGLGMKVLGFDLYVLVDVVKVVGVMLVGSLEELLF